MRTASKICPSACRAARREGLGFDRPNPPGGEAGAQFVEDEVRVSRWPWPSNFSRCVVVKNGNERPISGVKLTATAAKPDVGFRRQDAFDADLLDRDAKLIFRFRALRLPASRAEEILTDLKWKTPVESTDNL